MRLPFSNLKIFRGEGFEGGFEGVIYLYIIAFETFEIETT